jgi:hypothetical protein
MMREATLNTTMVCWEHVEGGTLHVAEKYLRQSIFDRTWFIGPLKTRN